MIIIRIAIANRIGSGAAQASAERMLKDKCSGALQAGRFGVLAIRLSLRLIFTQSSRC